jgi:hypothetical protein
MFDTLLVLASLGFELYALIDAARTDQDAVRSLPKWAWIIIILLFGLFGSVAWFFIGRPKGSSGPRARRPRSGRPVPPDDNPEFLGNL